MATAAEVTIAEAGEVVAPACSSRNRSRPRTSTSTTSSRRHERRRQARIAERAARELQPGEVVNLGIGIPNLIPGFLDEDAGVYLQTENGLLGVGPRPSEDELDPDLIDAAKEPVTALPGRVVLRQRDELRDDSWRPHRRGGARRAQVSSRGDIANWAVPGKDVLGVGGAMDLVVGARRVVITMTATSSKGEAKLVPECTYPLTAVAAADVVVTELGVFRRVDGGLHLTELLEGATLDDVAP